MPAVLSPSSCGSRLPSHEQDGAIHQEAIGLLQTSGYAHLARLNCRVADGVIVLMGQVPTFFLKQMAQTIVMRNRHALGIRNEVRVA
jgi:hypothetical protein